MTRPVYEPTPAREDARLGFGSNQLFRRPAPTTSAGSEIKSIITTYAAAPQVVSPFFGVVNVLFDTITNRNPECFEVEHDASSGSEYDVIRMLEDGVYTVMIRVDAFVDVAFGQYTVALALFRYDDSTLSSKTWVLDGAQGYTDAHYTWTFEMDGTNGSNRRVSIQFMQTHPSIPGTDDNVNLANLTWAVYKWPGTITL